MKSDSVNKGIARSPHRALFKALGFIAVKDLSANKTFALFLHSVFDK
jgi:hypothetical protein